jgi:hypothetical protein
LKFLPESEIKVAIAALQSNFHLIDDNVNEQSHQKIQQQKKNISGSIHG